MKHNFINDVIDNTYRNENSRCGFDHRAFALDIINQCLDECADAMYYGDSTTAKQIADAIKNKFNINENQNIDEN